MSPTRVTCPKCNGALDSRTTSRTLPTAIGYEFPEFPCPHCDAILAIPDVGEAYSVMVPSVLLSILPLMFLLLFLRIMAPTIAQGPNLALLFISTIIAVVASLELARVVLGKMRKNLRVEVVGIRPTCENCRYTAIIRDAVYCTRCGSGPLRSAMAESTLETQLGMLDPRQCIPDSFILRVRSLANDMVAQGRVAWASRTCQHCGTVVALDDALFCSTCGEKLPILLKRNAVSEDQTEIGQLEPRISNEQSVGTCLICDLEMSPADSLARCPKCGNIFHKSHLIQWVRMKHCPVCGERLAESEIIIVSNEKLLEGDS